MKQSAATNALAPQIMPPLGWRARFLLLFISLSITALVIEVAFRYADGNALPQLRLFRSAPDGQIDLEPDASTRLWRPGGAVYHLFTDAHGLRIPRGGVRQPPGGWLAVGDSQVMGMGVEWEATFAARAEARGLTLYNAGVPGYGVEDAVKRAETLIGPLKARGVLVFINQINDWEDVRGPAPERFRVVGGWLLEAKDAHGLRKAFAASPLSGVHCLFYAVQALGLLSNRGAHASQPPEWLARPEQQAEASRRIASSVTAFAKAHRELETIAVYLPADVAVSEERAKQSRYKGLNQIQPAPWMVATLRDQVQQALKGEVKLIDLVPTLRGRADAFQEHDYHLSETGHTLVADRLLPAMMDSTGPRTPGASSAP